MDIFWGGLALKKKRLKSRTVVSDDFWEEFIFTISQRTPTIIIYI